MNAEIKKIKEISEASDIEKTKKIEELNRQLKENIVFHESEISAKEELKKKLLEKMKEKDDLHQAEIEGLNIEIQGEKDTVKRIQQLLDEMTDKNNSLQEKIKLLEIEGQQLGMEKNLLEEQVRELEKLKDKNNSEIEALKQTNEAELTSKASESALLRKQIEELEAENSRLMKIIVEGTTTINRVVLLLKQLDDSQRSQGEKASGIEESIKKQIQRETTILSNIKNELARPGNETYSGDEEPPPDPTSQQKQMEKFNQLEKLASVLPEDEEETVVFDANANNDLAKRIPIQRKKDPKTNSFVNKGGTRRRRRHSTKRIRRRRSTKRRCNKKRRTTRKRRKQRGGYTYSAKTSV
jgi:hypothetical protein